MVARHRWAVLAVIYLPRIAMGFQFQSIASVGPPLMADLGIDHTGLGSLIGFFMLPGLIVAMPAGVLGRWLGDKPTVLLGLGLMVLGGIAIALADGFALAAVARIMCGTGAILMSVMMMKMLTDWFAGKDIIFASAIYLNGWPFGAAIGLAAQPYLAEAFGWRWVLATTAVLCALGLLMVLAFYRAPASADSEPAALPPAPVRSRDLFRLERKEWILISLIGLVWANSSASYVIILGFAAPMLTARGFDPVEAGLIVSLQIWVALVAMPLGGFIVERLRLRASIIVLSTISIGCAQLGLLAVEWPHALFVLLGIVGGLPAGIVVSLAAESMRPEHRAVGLGLFYTWFYSGMGLAPAIAGAARDATLSADAPIVAAACGSFLALGAFGIYRLVSRRLGPLT